MVLTPSSLGYTDTFASQYHALPQAIKKKVNRKLRLLSEDVHHESVRPCKVKSDKRYWEFKVDDDYEAVFKLNSARVMMYFVVDHKTFDKMF